jgi:hypothetical protein
MKPTTRHILLAAIAVGGLTASVEAQNPNFAPGDLVLFFQNPGGTTGAGNTVMVNLGSSALFRDAIANSINLLNIGALLSDPVNGFGPGWWESDTLYMGISGVWGNSALGTQLQNGDPQRTLYASRPRNGVGTLGSADSDAWVVLGDTDMTTGANRMFSLQNVLETQYATGTASAGTGTSQVDDQNPFTAPGVQGTAFGIFPGGVQDQFGIGSFGNFAGVQAEAAVDLYRILARNNVSGQVGGPVRTGTYEGTFVVDQAGNVSHVVVPEPSTAVLLGFGALALGMSRRRRAQTA